MSTVYMTPGLVSANPFVSPNNGNTYTYVDTPIAVPDFDAAVMAANGWQAVQAPLQQFGAGGTFIYSGDADTQVPKGPNFTVVYNSPITATRNVLLNTAATAGDKVHVVRTAAATGAFNVVSGAKSLTAAGTFCEMTYDGTQWIETAAGTL